MNPIENIVNTVYNEEELKQKYARVGLSPYITALFARSKIKKPYMNRKEGPILANVETAILNSIKFRWLLNVSYVGFDEFGNSPGRRWVECYTYGLHKTTLNHLVRCWQYKGVTTSEIPGWKLFRLDRIRGVAVLSSKTFNTPRFLFNPFDEDMGSIISVVKFPDENRN